MFVCSIGRVDFHQSPFVANNRATFTVHLNSGFRANTNYYIWIGPNTTPANWWANAGGTAANDANPLPVSIADSIEHCQNQNGKIISDSSC